MNDKVSKSEGHQSVAQHAVVRIWCRDRLIAIIVLGEFSRDGIHSFTPAEFSQQLAYMHHPPGRKIAPHMHQLVPRQVLVTQEVLFIRKGSIRVDFYDNDQTYFESRI